MWLGANKNRHQKGIMYLKEIELRFQNILTILGSILNIIGGTIWPLNEYDNLHFDNEYDLICTLEILKLMAMGTI